MRTSPLPFTWIAAAALVLGGNVAGQQRAPNIRPITTTVQNAGVYHLATGTWSAGLGSTILTSPEVLYDNTCSVGSFWGLPEGTVVWDSGRIPSTTSPSNSTSLTGMYDAYTVDSFTISYCSFEPNVTSLAIGFVDHYAACDAGGTLPTPMVVFNLVDVPGGTSSGDVACWEFVVNLEGSPFEFDLVGDATGAYDGVPSMDSFGWSWTQLGPTTGQDSGPILAGDPLGFFSTDCGGVGDGTTFPLANSALAGTGIGTLDQVEAAGGSTVPNCYWFGGYDSDTPMASCYLKLTGRPDNGAIGDPSGKFAIRGTGHGVSYEWKVLDMSDTLIASGSSTTALGASAADMRDQLVDEINNAAVANLSATDGGWSPGGNWQPFVIHYSVGGTVEEIQLIIDGCNVSNAPLSTPCHFNPEIASASANNTGNAFCYGDGSGTACPCGNASGTGQGCSNSTGAGAILTGSGNASVTADSLNFAVTGVNGPRFGLLLRANNQLGGGGGVAIGDGLLCVGGNSARSQVFVTDASGAATISNWNGGPLGAVANPPGTATQFQFWYRDPMGSPCGTIFNFSNAWTTTYLP